MDVRYADRQYKLRDGRWASCVRLKFWGGGTLTEYIFEPRSIHVGIFATEQEAIAYNGTLAAQSLAQF